MNNYGKIQKKIRAVDFKYFPKWLYLKSFFYFVIFVLAVWLSVNLLSVIEKGAAAESSRQTMANSLYRLEPCLSDNPPQEKCVNDMGFANRLIGEYDGKIYRENQILGIVRTYTASRFYTTLDLKPDTYRQLELRLVTRSISENELLEEDKDKLLLLISKSAPLDVIKTTYTRSLRLAYSAKIQNINRNY
jgi:hypothetical protein